MPAKYADALEYIHSFDDPYLAAIRDHGKQTWGLAKIEALLEKIGRPERSYPVIHVAGTKGKGSTSALIAQALAESGLKVGLYSSPHLEDWRERIQVNRHLIAEESVVALADDIRPFAEAVPGLSAFEVGTALAFWHFARERVDAAVIEVGLGGRLDATNVVEPLVSVITSISLDHTQLLGNTLAEIAGEKAAIIKQRRPVVSAPQKPEAGEVIARRAADMDSRLVRVGQDWQFEVVEASLDGTRVRISGPGTSEVYDVGLPGLFQAENAAVAAAALVEAKQVGLPVTEQGVRDGLMRVRWPGRLEVIQKDPLVVLDGAHNPYSVGKLVESLKALEPGKTPVFIFGCMADKDVEDMLRHLMPGAQWIIFTRAETGRAATVSDLQAAAQKVAAELKDVAPGSMTVPELSWSDDVPHAVEIALGMLNSESLLCITGSLAIAGEARTALAEKRHASSPWAAAEVS